MALQGTLDTFALSDVLRLLAATKKTGRLWVSGTRGSGSVWVDQGAVVAGEAPAADSSEIGDVVFELLRYSEGSFDFEVATRHAAPGTPVFVEPLLAETEERLLEWHLIEAVVPSLGAWVSLVAELATAEVVIDAERWRGIVAVARGCTVGQIGTTLGLAEVAVSRHVKGLVEMGLVTVDAAAPHHPAPADPDPEPVYDAPAPPANDPRDDDESYASPLGQFGRDEVVPLAGGDDYFVAGHAERRAAPPTFEEFEPINRPSHAPAYRDEAAEAAPQRSYQQAGAPTGPTFAGHDEAPGDDEVVRQLASLSPRAARAVAAAARAETVEERDAALAEVTADGEAPINRGLLLKFLSSVKQ